MKKVMVFGTFDTLHRGHIFFLRQAAEKGDYLVAVVARDKTVDELKGRDPYHPFGERISRLKETGLVNKTLPSDEARGSWKVIQKERPQVICLGHDQNRMEENLRHWLNLQRDYSPEIVILPPYKRHVYSSTAERRRRKIAFYFLLFLSMTLMALSWISGKIVSAQAPFTLLVFWRFFFSLIPFIPFPPHRENFSLPPEGARYTLLSALFLLLYNYLFFGGLSLGLAGKGGVIVTTLNPLITTLLILLTERKRAGKTMALGLGLGLTGGIILMEPWLFSRGELLARGNIYFLAAAACWALLTLCSGKAQETIPLKKYNFYLYLFTTAASFILALPAKPFHIAALSGSFWLNILYLSLFVSALATSLYFKAAARLGASRASAFTFLIPLLALGLSWALLGEIPRIPTIIGGSLSLGALYFINKEKHKELR
ncbi:MAG: EamA family transporter [Spirochaetales bacterium]|nr:EamA family transporter [Spirochaetales bacterium]